MYKFLFLACLQGIAASAAEPYLVFDHYPGPESSRPIRNEFIVFNDALWLTLAGPNGYRELYKSDGTAEGTVFFSGFDPLGPSNTRHFHILDGYLYFVTRVRALSIRDSLWRTDGTLAGTTEVHFGNAIWGFTRELNGSLYFIANNKEVYRVDNAMDRAEFTGFQFENRPVEFEVANGRFFAKVPHLIRGGELWSTDLTVQGSVYFDIFPNQRELLYDLNPLDHGIVFSALDAYGDYEPWWSDGTVEGTYRLKSIGAGPAGSHPSDFTRHKDKMYFSATDTFLGKELFVTDGTRGGTRLVKDINTTPDGSGGTQSAEVRAINSVGEYLYFWAEDGSVGRWWRTDGSEEGTVAYGALAGESGPTHRPFFINGAYYALGALQDGRYALYRGDGSRENNVLHAVFPLMKESSYPLYLGTYNGVYYFTFESVEIGSELWGLNLPPIVSSITLKGDTLTNGSTVTFEVAFSEDVSGVDSSDFLPESETLEGVSVIEVRPVSARVYEVDVHTGVGDGELYLAVLDDGSIRDAADTALEGPIEEDGARVSDVAFLIDRSAPRPVLSTTGNNPTSNPRIPVSLDFAEPVVGFEASDLSASNAAIEDFTGNGAQFSFKLAPLNAGLVSVSVPAGVCSDIAGNLNSISNSLNLLYQPGAGEGEGEGDTGEGEEEGGMEGEGEGAVEGEEEGMPLDIQFEVEVTDDGYIPGEKVRFDVTFVSNVPVDKPRFHFTPEGNWTYAGLDEGDEPDRKPSNGSGGLIALEYEDAGIAERHFSFFLQVPALESGNKIVYATVRFLYNFYPEVRYMTLYIPEHTILEGEGNTEGEDATEGEGDGAPEGEGSTEGEGEGAPGPFSHSADQNNDGIIILSELLRVIQFFNTEKDIGNAGIYTCDPSGESEDGYLAGSSGDQSCRRHSADYLDPPFRVNFSELLRLIQFFNTGNYHRCPDQVTEDGFCPGELPL